MMHNLDLRGVACPLNFVKTKLYLDKLSEGEILQVNLDPGEPIESVYNSIQAEGHTVNKPQANVDGSFVLTITKVAIILLLQVFVFMPHAFAVNMRSTIAQSASNQPAKFNVTEQITIAKKAVLLAPTDVNKRLQLARLLRRSGNYQPGAIEYLNITVLNPAYSVAYHEMLLCKPTVGQIDEAIARLKDFKVPKNRQLACTMVLSELYEGKEDYYQAARVLVDLQYSQNLPQKYVPQVASRIHVLLGKTKDNRTIEKAIEQKTNVEEEEFNPSSPLPMPDVAATNTDVPTRKFRNSKEKEGYGHAQLSP